MYYDSGTIEVDFSASNKGSDAIKRRKTNISDVDLVPHQTSLGSRRNHQMKTIVWETLPEVDWPAGTTRKTMRNYG